MLFQNLKKSSNIILGLGIHSLGIWNPSSPGKVLESINWNPEPTAFNPESKTVLDSLTWGKTGLSKGATIWSKPLAS